jgi:hypothetical protein
MRQRCLTTVRAGDQRLYVSTATLIHWVTAAIALLHADASTLTGHCAQATLLMAGRVLVSGGSDATAPDAMNESASLVKAVNCRAGLDLFDVLGE